MRTARPTSATTDPSPPASRLASPDGACVAASERPRGAAHVRNDARLEHYRDGFRDAAYYSTGRDWEDYAPAYRCGLDAFAARRASSLRFSDVESSVAAAWTSIRGDSRLGWAEARGAVLDAWLRQCDAQSGGPDRRPGARRSSSGMRRRSEGGAAPGSDVKALPQPAAAAADACRSPAMDAPRASVADPAKPHSSQAELMSTLKKDHVTGTGGGAVAGGTTGAAIGAVVGGPVGLAIGAVAGTAVGAIAGHRASNAIAPDSELGHFEDVFESMPYYVSEMKWTDYAPAYRYGLDTHASHGVQGLDASETALEAGWPKVKGGSRLLWSEAREPVAHAWRALDESRLNATE